MLEMADAMEAPAQWLYGLTPVGHERVRAMFGSIEESERVMMLLELLRVLHMIIQDIAEAVQESTTEVLVEPAEASGNAGTDSPRQEEEDKAGARAAATV